MKYKKKFLKVAEEPIYLIKDTGNDR